MHHRTGAAAVLLVLTTHMVAQQPIQVHYHAGIDSVRCATSVDLL